MVCKENVVSWFGNLSSYKRIDVMCTLLNKCVPFEVRYLGTCVEEIGKRDYNELRESEHHANSESDLSELTTLGVGDKRTRRKLALYMALLHSANYACADVLHKILSTLESPEVFSSILSTSSFPPDDQPLEELLLLYTMALNHPAFTYEQKRSISNVYLKLQEEEARLSVSKPAVSVNSSYKTAQGSGACTTPNERSVSADSGVEMPANCSMPPPPIQTYHGNGRKNLAAMRKRRVIGLTTMFPGEMPMRNNAMVSGVPPGLTLPPPGLCLPGPDHMTMGTTHGAQYLHHVSFPTVNHMWPGQVMMGNQLVYHTSEMLAYPPSPLVSRQSSPSQSRSPSRSNSPLGRRNNQMPRTSSQVTQSTSNTLTTSVSATNSQPIASTNVATHHPPPSLGCPSRGLPGGQPPMLPPRSAPPPIINTSSSAYSRLNSIDNTSTVAAPMTSAKQQPPPPPRLRSSMSGDSLRDSQPKEMPNFKGSLQNSSLDEIRRMSDEDLKEIGLTPSAVGQLRNIVRSQTTNGLSQLGMEKKLDGTNNATHPVVDQTDNEEAQQQQQQQMQQPPQQQQSLPQQQPLQQQQQQQAMHIPHNHANAASIRRYPTMPPLDPATMQMYPPPPIYATQSQHCYGGCISAVPVTGMPSRYTRCNGQNVYCLAQIQALRLDPESSRHCSQSSSSESTGSRSPPETPPAAPWVNNAPEISTAPPTSTDHSASGSSHHSTVTVSHQSAQPMQQIPERPRNQSKKNQSHVMRQKNQMANGASGGGNGSSTGSGGGCAVPPNIPHCSVQFSGPPTPSVTFLQHGHFSALRPSTGIYPNFSHAAYARPTYHAAYQPNGEILYQYPGQPGPGGTPPPPTVAAPPQTYMPSAPVVPYTPASQPAKISCYNCGSCSHLASDCKDQTMEELTKRAPYRLDYTVMKQPGDLPSSDK